MPGERFALNLRKSGYRMAAAFPELCRSYAQLTRDHLLAGYLAAASMFASSFYASSKTSTSAFRP
jgi:hypothetical protein